MKLLLVAIVSYFFSSTANAYSYQEYLVRASLTLNLIRFTEWPSDALKSMGDQFNLCLIGNPALEEAFASLNGKTVSGKTLQVRYISRLNTISGCHLLYISELDKFRLSLLLNDITPLPLLTVGEDDYFVKNGGMVSLQIQQGKISITVNLKAANKSKLSISARVLKLATVLQ